jgi:hypothetical protein
MALGVVSAIMDRFMADKRGITNELRRHRENNACPIVVAVEMGYGHLRAAYTIANYFSTDVVRMDLPPWASPAEAAIWRGVSKIYNTLSCAGDWPLAGPAAQRILEKITEISHFRGPMEVEPASFLTYCVDRLTRSVFGRRLRALATDTGRPILATYPAAALAARHAPGARVFCLATDTDLNRAWAPANANWPYIEYLAPVNRVADRLRSFGVSDRHIHLTGFPLADGLIANSQTALRRRLYRLNPKSTFHDSRVETFLRNPLPNSSRGPIAMTVAIGGAGAQVCQVEQMLRSLRKMILNGKLHLTLVAGTRADIAKKFDGMVQSAGLVFHGENGVQILFADKPVQYFRRFEECLIDTDLLWTKPSELVFYAALGLPILLAPPVGGQEHANRNWLLSHHAALDAGDPAVLDQRLDHLIAEGELCRIAWNAYSRLERNGLERIREVIDAPVENRIAVSGSTRQSI